MGYLQHGILYCFDGFFFYKCMNLGSSLLRDVLGPASCAYYKPILLVLWLFMLKFIEEMMKSGLIEWLIFISLLLYSCCALFPC